MKVKTHIQKSLGYTNSGFWRESMAVSAHIQKKLQTNNLMTYFKNSENQGPIKSHIRGSQEIIRIKAYINEIETKKYKRSRIENSGF